MENTGRFCNFALRLGNEPMPTALTNMNKFADINKRLTDITNEALALLTEVAKTGFKMPANVGWDNDMYFSNFRGCEMALCGMGMENGEPVVYGVHTESEIRHTTEAVPLKFINRDDLFWIVGYLYNIVEKNLAPVKI